MTEKNAVSRNKAKAVQYVEALLHVSSELYQINSKTILITDDFLYDISVFFKKKLTNELQALMKKVPLKLSNLCLAKEKVIVKPGFQVISGAKNKYLYEINKQKNPPYRVAFGFSENKSMIVLLGIFLKGANNWENIIKRITANKNRIEKEYQITFFERGGSFVNEK